MDDSGGADFTKIQEAINAANPGDTIFVEAGTYNEHIVVDKSISLIGESPADTIIDANWTGTTVAITANNVSISGFTIQHGHLYGVHLIYSSGNIIVNNTIAQNDITDITFTYSNSNRVEDNIVTSSYLDHSYNNVIANNTINLSLRYSDNNVIINNKITEDGAYGIEITNSNNNTVQNNAISTGYYSAISLWKAFCNKIVGNVILAYEGTSLEVYDSIHVDRSGGNTIRNNVINSNYTRNGISLVGNSTNNTIVSNTIATNKKGVFLWQSSENIIYHNNFVDNTQQVSSDDYTNSWDDGYPSGGNYWSDYVGVDVKKGSGQDLPGSDGIGDTPYVIDADNMDHYPLMNPYAPPPPTYSLTITTTVGGTTDTAPGTYSYTVNSQVQVTAIPNPNYLFHHWELDSINVGSVNPYSVLMDKNHALKAVFSPIPPPPKPVGGYSILIQAPATEKPLSLYLAIMAILTAAFTTVRYKTHKRRK